MATLRALKRRVRKDETLARNRERLVVEWLTEEGNIQDLLTNPLVAGAFAKELVSALNQQDPNLIEALRAAVTKSEGRNGGCLSNVEILAALEDGRLTVTPAPVWEKRPGRESGFDTDTFTIHLGTSVVRLPDGGEFDSRRISSRKFISRYGERSKLERGQAVRLKPGERILWFQRERIAIAARRRPDFGTKPLVSLRLSGITRWARVFLKIEYADVYHPGDDHIQVLEIKNDNPGQSLSRWLKWLFHLKHLPGQLGRTTSQMLSKRQDLLRSTPKAFFRSLRKRLCVTLREHRLPTGLVIVLYPGDKIGQVTVLALLGDPEVEDKGGHHNSQKCPSGAGAQQVLRPNADVDG